MQVSRYDSLDSMRGIAAALVVLNHCYCAFADKSEGAVWWLANTPLRMLVSGRPSVILFFVLSGFVLAVSLEKGMKYRDFVVRRFCRIYLPFAAAIVLALVLHLSVGRAPLPGYSPEFNFTQPLDLRLLAGHFLMLGDYVNVSLDKVMWSLVYELRISLVFPVIMWLTYRYPAGRVLAASLAPAMISYAALRTLGYGPREFHYATSAAASFWLTVHFATFFVIGTVVAKHRHELMSVARERSPLQRFAIAAVSSAVLLPASFVITDIPVGILSAILIVLVLAGGTATRAVFNSRPALFLGRISYSLYLVHLPLFFFVARAWPGGAMPLAYVWLVWPPLALLTATAAYYLVEQPSQTLGRSVVAWFNGAPRAVATAAGGA